MSDLNDDLSALSLKDEPQPKKKRPLLLFLVLGFAVLALVALAFIYLQISHRPIAVRLAEATLKTRWAPDVVLIATGHVEPKARASAAALSPGRVKSIEVAQSQLVEAEDIVATMDKAVMEAQLKEAKAALVSAKASLGAARRQVALAKKQRNQDELSAALAAAAAGTAAIRAAEARIAAARTAVQHTQVKAPIGGVIWKLHVTVGQSLAEGSLKVADIADMSTLYVDADVSESKLGVTSEGMAADIVLDAFPSRHYDAKVVELRPEVNKETATGVVRVELIGGGTDVLLNMAGRVSFLRRAVPLAERNAPAKVMVPAAAVTERDGVPCVFAFASGVAAMLKVQKGEAVGSDVEILGGLRAGERVVLSPPSDLEEGRALELMP